jgi:hypothetical protein
MRQSKEVVYIIDEACPASKSLDKNYIESAKKVALTSIRRFDKKTYNRWLKNNVGWVKKTSRRFS